MEAGGWTKVGVRELEGGSWEEGGRGREYVSRERGV